VNCRVSSLFHGVDLPVPAVRPQPLGHHRAEVRAHTPTAPWGSRRLPRTLLPDDPRRTLYRSLLRRAEGVPVRFAGGDTGVVSEVVLPELGFDFWPEALLVATADGRRRVPVDRVARIETRGPRLELAVSA
jgi:hypothetical protein